MVWRRTNPRDCGEGNGAGGDAKGEGSSAGRTVSHWPSYRQDIMSLPIPLDGSLSEDPRLTGVSRAELASDPPGAELFLFFARPPFLHWRESWWRLLQAAGCQ